MSVAIRKLDGIESVDVSLEKASADIALKPGNRITLAQLREVIRKSGYPTKDAQISARGRIVDRAGRPLFDLQNGSSLALDAPPKDAPASDVEISGISRPAGKNGERLTITAIRQPIQAK